MPLLDQTALALLRHVAENGVVTAPNALEDGEGALSRAGLIRTVLVDQESPALVLTGRGVRASGALPWSIRPLSLN